MSLPILLVTLVASATLALSASLPVESNENPTESNVETFDSYSVQNLPQHLPLTIQLPREEQPAPFYPAAPVPYLRAPQFIPNSQPNYYQVPVPSEYLTAPTEGAWNPDDDPALYYELPASITKENVPTNQYPKKFNNEIHTKSKPLSAVPKKEIALEPINESQYAQKQKELYKTVQKLNKKENQREIEQEKVPKYVINSLRKPQPIDNTSHQTRLTKPVIKVTSTTQRPLFKIPVDSSRSESTFERQFDNKPEQYDTNKYTKGLSPQITDSLGLSSSSSSSNHGSGGGERVLFHMVGHDGPMSYKWGYDTGKGHNRQFRFEERDKEGVVKGQFGYYDKEGKFRMMNYNAHPDNGFHMEPAPESEVKE